MKYVFFYMLTALCFASPLQADMCHVFKETWIPENLYQLHLQKHQKLSVESSYQQIVEKLSQQKVSITEVIAFLDAHRTTSESLVEKLRTYRDPHAVYESQFLRYLTRTVKSNHNRLLIQRKTITSEKELADFVNSLLTTIHSIEMRLLKTQLSRFFPNAKAKIEAMIEADSFFYRNYDVFARFLDLATKDSISSNSLWGLSTHFLFMFMDPMLSHRLNLVDLQKFKNETLNFSHSKPLYVQIISDSLQRKIAWGFILSGALMLPISFLEAQQYLQPTIKMAEYGSTHSSVLIENANQKYSQIFMQLREKKLAEEQQLLQAARSKGDQEAILQSEALIEALKHITYAQ